MRNNWKVLNNKLHKMDNTAAKTETNEVEIVQDAAISLITKAEIDMQIATAHAFPRSLTRFIKEVMSMATINEDVAQSCAYALPRGGKTIEGPSVRLAEIVASSYGNLRTGARVIYNDGKVVTAQGIVHDLEKNILHTEEVQRRITDKNGKTYSEDMQVIAGRAACAIAYRNAIFKVVPAALVQDCYDKVKDIARGNAETLVARREKAINYFRGMGIKDQQLFEVLEVKGLDDIDLDKLQLLSGMKSALKNGEATLESLFPPPDAKTKAENATKSAEDKLNKKGKTPTQQMEADLGKTE